MSPRTAIAVLLIALCATTALGTIYRTIGRPGGGLYDHPSFVDARNWPPNSPRIGADELDDTSGTLIDVGVYEIERPVGQVQAASVVSPLVWIHNYGGVSVNTPVYVRIDSSGTVLYLQTVSITDVEPGHNLAVAFPDFGVSTSGPCCYRIQAWTDAFGDENWANDSLDSLFWVVGVGGSDSLDAATVSIDAPTGDLTLGQPYSPLATVRNNSSAGASFEVVFSIEGSPAYESRRATPTLNPGDFHQLQFDAWTPNAVGTFGTMCSTELDGDVYNDNDWLEDSVRVIQVVERLDAAAVRITSPVGTVCGRDTIEPVATVRNQSSTAQSFNVRFSIGDGPDWTSVRTTPVLQPGEEYEFVFESWLPAGPGLFEVKCSTELDGDVDNSNDRVLGGAVKVLLWDAGWVEMAPIPLGPSNRGITDGAWLAHRPFEQYVYANKGDRTDEFYRYDIDGNDWQALAPVPWGREHKLPFMGSRGIRGDSCFIYATKGHNTFGFWRYNTETNEWTQLTDVPRRPNGDDEVSYGTDLTYVPGDSWRYGNGSDSVRGGHVYLLKGHSGEFYRYNVESGEWEERQHAPPDRHNELWKAGSFITFDGDRTIFAHRSFANEIWTFDIVDQQWSVSPRSGMPGVQSQDGGCGDWFGGAVFALKGGDTREFRAYLPGLDVWRNLEDMPRMGSNKQPRNVFWGADIIAHGCGAFFAFKGHGTLEFWRYVLVPGRLDGRQDAGVSRTRLGEARLDIATNPFAGRVLSVHYSLNGPGPATLAVVDVAGRGVVRQGFAANRTGRVQVDLRGLSAGVYLLQLQSAGQSVTRKLVLQR